MAVSMSVSSDASRLATTEPAAPGLQTKPNPWQLTPQEREEVSSSISQTWTDQAIKCYKLEANCSQCEIPKGQYSFVCQMNKVVPVLLDTVGEPDERRVKKLFPLGIQASIEAHRFEERPKQPSLGFTNPFRGLLES